jgi:hypothetical protein
MSSNQIDEFLTIALGLPNTNTLNIGEFLNGDGVLHTHVSERGLLKNHKRRYSGVFGNCFSEVEELAVK